MADLPISQSKVCTKCAVVKTMEAFPRDKGRADGRFPWCKKCKSSAAKRAHAENPEPARKRAAKRRAEKPEAMVMWREQNAGRVRAYNVNWYWTRKDQERARERKWNEENPDYRPAYYAKNRSRINTARRLWREAPKVRLDNAISRAIHHALRGEKRGRRWEDLVGYTVEDLMAHLERRFAPGMKWSNYGRGGWHVDHRIPKSVFNYEAPEHIDFKRAWAIDNLQPMWEPDNLAKAAKLESPFQPSLAI